jgi:flagellar protein FlgJ
VEITAITADAAGELKKKGGSADKNTQAAKKVAREFESLMVNEMIKSMRATAGKDPLTSGGRGEEIYQSMLDQEYAQAIARQGTVGLARYIEQQLIKTDSTSAVQPKTERRE